MISLIDSLGCGNVSKNREAINFRAERVTNK